jgi:hypothetical protein
MGMVTGMDSMAGVRMGIVRFSNSYSYSSSSSSKEEAGASTWSGR